MKIFLDTNTAISAFLTRGKTLRLHVAADEARWRLIVSEYVLDETTHVLVDYLGFSAASASRAVRPVAELVDIVGTPQSRHSVSADPKDTPILRAALGCGADYLVTDDKHLLSLDPYEGLRMITISQFERMLHDEGLL